MLGIFRYYLCKVDIAILWRLKNHTEQLELLKPISTQGSEESLVWIFWILHIDNHDIKSSPIWEWKWDALTVKSQERGEPIPTGNRSNRNKAKWGTGWLGHKIRLTTGVYCLLAQEKWLQSLHSVNWRNLHDRPIHLEWEWLIPIEFHLGNSPVLVSE